MNHKQRRIASYKKRGLKSKVFFAQSSMNNRSRRARGKMRVKIGWTWTGKPGEKFAKASIEHRVGGTAYVRSLR